MQVRPAIPADEAAVVAMAAYGVPEVFPHLTFSPVRARESFRQAMQNLMPVYFVAFTPANQVVGVNIVYWGNSDFSTGICVEQRAIFVDPQFRGSGAAAALLRNLEQWAAGLGADELYVNVASGNRQRATARYVRRFGFEDVGSVLRKVRRK